MRIILYQLNVLFYTINTKCKEKHNFMSIHIHSYFLYLSTNLMEIHVVSLLFYTKKNKSKFLYLYTFRSFHKNLIIFYINWEQVEK